MFSLDEKRLINRALRYSIAHLNVEHDKARHEGRTHEAAACVVEAERLTLLREKISNEISRQLKETSKRISVEVTTSGFTVSPTGLFAECTPRDVTADGPEQSG